MKILYTTHQFYPDYGAGTELLTYMTASKMRDKGHSVVIVTGSPTKRPSNPKDIFNQYTYENLTVHCYKHSNLYPIDNQCVMEAEHRNMLVKKWFLKIVDKYKPDLVHVFHLQRLSASILEACNELKIPYIITVTDFWIICPTTQLLLPDNCLCAGPQKMMENCIKHLSTKTSKPFFSHIIQKIPDKIVRGMVHLLRCLPKLQIGPFDNICALKRRPNYILEQVNQAKRIIVTNRFMYNILQKNGINSALMKKIPFGIKGTERIDESVRLKDGTLKIGFIGTLNYHKGAHVLLKAVRTIPESKKLSVKIYGNREQFPDYVRQLDAIKINDERIKFNGTFPPDRLWTVLRMIDVLVVPSLWYENTPLIIHQAHAAKVPVIATDLGGMNESVKDGVDGYLFTVDDDYQLSKILSSLLEDRFQLEKLRDQITPPMFIDQYTSVLEDQYREIIGESYGN